MTDDMLYATVSLRGVVFARGEVLTVRRASDGGWELPGGRIGASEDVVVGLRREVAEETGLEVDVQRPVHAISWRNEDDRGRFGVYFYCRSGVRSVDLSAEHDAAAWVAPSRAVSRLSDPQGRAVERAREAHRSVAEEA